MEYGTGVITFYDVRDNYGFIEPDDGSPDVVFRLRAGEAPLQVGDTVSYELVPRLSVTPRGAEALRVWKTSSSTAAV